MIDINKPKDASYIVIETLHKDRTGSRTIHVVQPTADHQSFKIGRGHESDIRIADISVSRLHATLHCTSKGIHIEDNNSKFGTLAMAREPLELDISKSYAVQMGRTLMKFSIQKKGLDRKLTETIEKMDEKMIQEIIENSIGRAASNPIINSRLNEMAKAEEATYMDEGINCDDAAI